MNGFQKTVAIVGIWFASVIVLMVFFLAYTPQSDVLAGFVMLLGLGCAVGGTIAISEGSGGQTALPEKLKREQQTRLERLADLLEDEDILSLEELVAHKEFNRIRYDN